MTQSTIAAGIVLITFVLYVLEWFPISVTTMIGLLAMLYTGILTPTEAFSGFTGTAVLLTMGMIIIVDALFESGVINLVEGSLSRIQNEKRFTIGLFVLSALMSVFIVNSALVAMLMPFVSSVAASSGGRIQKKNVYLTMACGVLIGGTGSMVGCTSPLMASSALEEVGAEPLEFFSTLPITLAIVAVLAVCYHFFLYDFQVKCFDFPETDNQHTNTMGKQLNKKKAAISVIVFLSCAVLFVIRPFGWDLGQIAITGALILVIARCVDGKASMRNMHWGTLITLGGALGIAHGFEKSGAGDVVVGWILRILGSGESADLAIMTIFLLMAYVLSLVLPDGSLVLMLTTMGANLAMREGGDPQMIAMACIFGSSLAFATPVATSTTTMVQIAGYRFKDYVKVGGVTSLIGLGCTWIAIVVMYGLV